MNEVDTAGRFLNFNVKLRWMAVEHWKHSFQYKHMHSSGIQQVSTSCQECGSASQLQGLLKSVWAQAVTLELVLGGLALRYLEAPGLGLEAGSFQKCPCLHHLSDRYCSWHVRGKYSPHVQIQVITHRPLRRVHGVSRRFGYWAAHELCPLVASTHLRFVQ